MKNGEIIIMGSIKGTIGELMRRGVIYANEFSPDQISKKS